MQHVRLEASEVVELASLVFAPLPAEAMLWGRAGPRRATMLVATFQHLLQGLGLAYGMGKGFVLSSLRSGGITALWQESRDLEQVRWRGRWSQMKTLDHYVQELPAARGLLSLSGLRRQELFALSDALPLLLHRLR